VTVFLSVAILLLAVGIDLYLGEPPSTIHPVVWMGRVAAVCTRIAPARGALAQFVFGAAMAIGIPFIFGWAAARVESATSGHPLVWLVLGAALAKTTFAIRALGQAAAVVRDAVADDRIDDARAGLRALCSRDPSSLGPNALVAASIESVAENASDSIVAPFFWFALFGLPGAMFYRAANTLDAMIGYRGRYEWLGKAAARLDDLMGFVPARITAALIVASAWLQGRDARGAARVLARDGAATESPNAGRPMAAMAGALGCELAKEGHYRLGDPGEPLAPFHIDRAWRLVRAAAVLAACLSAALLGVRLALVG
jgi:adenosylcobinamide-phosphate synthase